MALNLCQFGCQQGFVDALARWTEHYQGNKCFEPDLETDRGEPCEYTGSRSLEKANDAEGTHWTDIHGAKAYEDPKVPFKDDARRLVGRVFKRRWRWASNRVFERHAKRDVSSILKTKKVFAFVDEVFRPQDILQDGMQPSDHLLYIDQCSVSAELNRVLSWGPKTTSSQPNGDHLMFIFRESTYHGPHEDTVELFRADATQTAKNIHLSGLAQVKSYGLVGSIEVKGSMLPSFADDIETEMAFANGALSSQASLPTKVKLAFASTVSPVHKTRQRDVWADIREKDAESWSIRTWHRLKQRGSNGVRIEYGSKPGCW